MSISALGLDSPDHQPWVQVMLKYRMAAQNPNGTQTTVNNLCTSNHNIVQSALDVDNHCFQLSSTGQLLALKLLWSLTVTMEMEA